MNFSFTCADFPPVQRHLEVSGKRWKLSLFIRKMLLMTKLTCLLLLVTFLQVSAKGYSQDKISVEFSHTKISKVLHYLEKKSDYTFYYDNDELENLPRINLKVDNATVPQVLDSLSHDLAFNYSIIDNKLVVIRTGNALPRVQTVHGKVTDSTGNTLIGVTVQVKGTNNGTVTDANGEFSIEAPEDATLVFSYVGYQSKEVMINGRETMNIALSISHTGLNEVVVVGYGTQKKVDLTGAIETIDMRGIGTRPLTTASEALQGKVAGAFISQNSGQPGHDGASILIRGVGTFNNTDPLVIIDGAEGSLSDVNPQDIATISILKDAAASAIYGNRAANGVILITTKQGKAGKMEVEYTGYYGVQNVTTMPKTLKGLEYLNLQATAYYNTNGTYPTWYNDEYMNNYRNHEDQVMYPTNFNWSDFLLQPASMQSHHIAISGGTKDVQYMTSIGYLDQDGVAVGNNTQKLTFRSNLSTAFLKDHLHIKLQVSGDQETTNDLVGGMSNAFYYAYVVPPTVSMKIPGVGYSNYGYAYGAKAAGGFNRTTSGPINLRGAISLDVIKGLDINTSYELYKNFNQQKVFAPSVQLFSLNEDGSLTLPTPAVSSLSLNRSESLTSTFNAYAHYSKGLKGGHNLSGMVGFEARKYNTDSYQLSVSNLSVNLPEFGFGDPSTQLNNSNASDIAWLSTFARLNYNYQDKYLFEANIRNDGSSRFLRKWGVFPSISAGWRISEEPFAKNNLPWISNLKFRASWGKLGNESIGQAYAASDELGLNLTTDFNDQLYPAGAVTELANRNTSWETSEMTNWGIDYGFFSNKLSGSIDYFIKKTYNILMQVPVSSTLGLTTLPYQNVGKMNNRGIEISFNYHTKIRQVELLIGAMASHVRNVIISLDGRSPIINGALVEKEGYSFNSFYGFQTEGIYQSQQEIDNQLILKDKNGNPTNPYDGLVPHPGDIRFKDQLTENVNGKLQRDGIINDKDEVVIGNSYPKWTYSSNIGINWQGISLNLLFQGVYGINSLDQGFLTIPFFGGSANTGAWYVNAWTAEKPSKTIQQIYDDPSRASIISDYYLENASYLRLKNIELSYTIPEQWLKKIGLNTNQTSLMIYGNIQNAITWTKMRYGFDPEKPSTSLNTLQYPQVRIYSVGIDIKL